MIGLGLHDIQIILSIIWTIVNLLTFAWNISGYANLDHAIICGTSYILLKQSFLDFCWNMCMDKIWPCFLDEWGPYQLCLAIELLSGPRDKKWQKGFLKVYFYKICGKLKLLLQWKILCKQHSFRHMFGCFQQNIEFRSLIYWK